MYIVVNELEKDVLREIISIGLARAADSFSSFSKSGVLLDAPEVKIIEPKVLPDVIDKFEEIYYVASSEIQGELNGKTFLLFTSENITKIADVCVTDRATEEKEYKKQIQEMQLEISEIITDALAAQISKILQLNLATRNTMALFNNKASSVQRILKEMPEYQPFVITIKTQFRKLIKAVELPMIVVFDSRSVSELLHIIRRDNLYDYKLLKASSKPGY